MRAVATIAAASGPQTASGRRVSAASSRATSATASSRPDATGVRVDAAQRDRRAGVAQVVVGAEQERGHAVGDLDGAVGQRRRPVGQHEPQRAAGGERRGGGEAGEHVGALDALAGEQVGRRGAGSRAGA